MLGNQLFDECVNLIRGWTPKQKYPKETDYRDDLMDFLYDGINNSNSLMTGNRNIRIKPEAGRGLCDIAVGDRKVGIELKRELKSKSQMNRLQGQIDDYLDDYDEGVIIVLVGNVNKYVENELRHKLTKKWDKINNLGINQFRMKLINKSHTNENVSPKKQDSGFNLNTGDVINLI